MGEEQRKESDEEEQESTVTFDARWPTGHLSAEARLTWRAWCLIGTGALSMATALYRLLTWIVEAMR